MSKAAETIEEKKKTDKKTASKCLQPSPDLLSKLGSIIVYYSEIDGGRGNHTSRQTLNSLLTHEDVRIWIGEMHALTLLPSELEVGSSFQRQGEKQS
jgi:hypothetical protein